MTLEEMIKRQQELLNLARAEQRELTAEEQAEFDSLQRSIDSIRSAQPATANANTSNVVAEATMAERTRCMEITSLCRSFDVSEEEMKTYLDGNATVDSVRTAILNKLQTERTPLNMRGVADATVTVDAQDKFRSAAVDALLMRGGIELDRPAEGARELMGMSLRDMAIEGLGENGLNRKSSDEIFTMLQRQYFNPTAAFPSILDAAINKAYVEGHKKVNVTFDRWTKKGTLKDFKTVDNNYVAGPVGEFLEVPEGGELKHDRFSDAKKPTRKLKTYGREFTLTRQAFINDDIGAVTSLPARYAASARKTINKQCYQILVNNPAVYDGVNLFHANHGNLVTTGTGITQASLQAMILALQNQVDEFGEAIIVRPATIIVPSGMGFDIFTIFNSPTINTSGNTQAANPLFKYASSIEIVEDPTINVLCGGFGNVMPWFLLGSKEDTDFIQVDYLNGQEIPNIRRMEAPGTLGFIWDIYLDWGVSVMDYRGAIKNPGIQVSNPL